VRAEPGGLPQPCVRRSVPVYTISLSGEVQKAVSALRSEKGRTVKRTWRLQRSESGGGLR